MRDTETYQKTLEDAKKTEKKAEVKIRKGKVVKILKTLFTGGNIEEAPDSNRSNKPAENQSTPNEEERELPQLKIVMEHVEEEKKKEDYVHKSSREKRVEIASEENGTP